MQNQFNRAMGRFDSRPQCAAPRTPRGRRQGAVCFALWSGLALWASLAAAAPSRPGPSAGLAEIEACVSGNLPEAAGQIDFRVEAVDRTGIVTASRAEIRWRKADDELVQFLVRIAEPAKTAGTALLVVDREAGQPEFYLRLPDLSKVKRIRSRRLRGPVLGTDFSYEDLEHLRDPMGRPALELIGISEVEGRAAWLLETLPDVDEGSEYARVLTYVDQDTCVPVQIDLFGEEDRLHKRLIAPREEIKAVGEALLPHVFVMEDLRRDTHTILRIERFEASDDLPAAQFTRRALQESSSPAITR
jgi:hypothetical protein